MFESSTQPLLLYSAFAREREEGEAGRFRRWCSLDCPKCACVLTGGAHIQGCYMGRPQGPTEFNCTQWGWAMCAIRKSILLYCASINVTYTHTHIGKNSTSALKHSRDCMCHFDECVWLFFFICIAVAPSSFSASQLVMGLSAAVLGTKFPSADVFVLFLSSRYSFLLSIFFLLFFCVTQYPYFYFFLYAALVLVMMFLSFILSFSLFETQF